MTHFTGFFTGPLVAEEPNAGVTGLLVDFAGGVDRIEPQLLCDSCLSWHFPVARTRQFSSSGCSVSDKSLPVLPILGCYIPV